MSHGVGQINVVLRGSINASGDVTCMALETGIDSIFMKNMQYPFFQRKQYEYTSQRKMKEIREEVSE